MVAFFFTASQLLHDGLLRNLHFLWLEFSLLRHGLDGCLLLINDLIDDHFEILIGVVPFLFDALDLGSNACHFVVLFSHVCKFPLVAVCELIRRE